MLDLTLLQHFLAVTSHPNLAAAADYLHLTPGALSKSLKKLEAELQTSLFAREGRALKLNEQGLRLKEKAGQLLAASEQLKSEFAGPPQALKCRLAAPPLLQTPWCSRISARILAQSSQAQLLFEQRSEHAAVAAVLAGECDLAVLTQASLAVLDQRLHAVVLGETEFRLAIGAKHPLAGMAHAPAATVLQYPFASLLTAPLTVLQQQPSSDGWRDDALPRQIRYRSDDLLTICALVAEGKALAYLPEQVITSAGLSMLKVEDCPYHCRQQVLMVCKRAPGSSWLRRLVQDFEHTPLQARG
jgi:DNA-binding transcriptional LysR family regulator